MKRTNQCRRMIHTLTNGGTALDHARFALYRLVQPAIRKQENTHKMLKDTK